MAAISISEFKPTIIFLLKFIGLYFSLSLLYGFYVEAYEPKPDPATVWVTNQTADVLGLLGWKTETYSYPNKPTTSIQYQGKGMVSVYEGCNGINVIIIFLSFLFAFGPVNNRMAWAVSAGMVIIHIANLGRIAGLFFVVHYLPGAVYFSHKYLFTAFIYAVVFALWMVWLRINYAKRKV